MSKKINVQLDMDKLYGFKIGGPGKIPSPLEPKIGGKIGGKMPSSLAPKIGIGKID